MKIGVTETDNKITVALEGDLDTSAAQETEKIFHPLFEEKNKEIIIDCRNLSYISSSGLRLFLSLLKSCHANDDSLVLENVNDNIKKVFTMTGFSTLFDMK